MVDIGNERAAGVMTPGVVAIPVRAVSARRPYAFRRTLQTIHLWLGLILCLPMIAIGLTGSALLVQRQILLMSLPSASTTGAYQPLPRMIEAAQTAVPSGVRANSVELPRWRGQPAAVQFVVSRQPVQTVVVYVDPVSLKVLDTTEIVRRRPTRDFLVNIHEFLMLPGHIGLPLVGWMAVAMTFMGISGIILWWPRPGRWLSAFLVRRGARGLRLHLDLHHAVGIWGSLIFLILSLSGIYLAFPQSVSSAIRVALPSDPPDIDRDFASVARTWPMDPDKAIAIARDLVPNSRPSQVHLPVREGTPLVVQLDTLDFWPAVPPITVTFDPANRDFVSVDNPQEYSLADRLLNVGYAMHFSLGMGFVWTFLIFLAGLLPLFLAVTGLSIWWMKRPAR